MNKLVSISVAALALAAFAPSALAKGAVPAQNHHCKLPDGTMDTAKTHKQCKAAKGHWVKDQAAAGAATPTPTPPPAK